MSAAENRTRKLLRGARAPGGRRRAIIGSGHGTIPAAYISMIGRAARYRGAGYGSDLLVDALRRIAQAAEAMGIAVVMLDVLDCGDPEKVARRKALYEGFGFTPLASNPLRMFLPMATVHTLIDETRPRGVRPAIADRLPSNRPIHQAAKVVHTPKSKIVASVIIIMISVT